MLNRILVPLDGSELAERALVYADFIARPTSAKVLLVRAAISHTLAGVDGQERRVGAIHEAEEYLAQVKADLTERGLEVETVVPYGPAAECIADRRAPAPDRPDCHEHPRSDGTRAPAVWQCCGVPGVAHECPGHARARLASDGSGAAAWPGHVADAAPGWLAVRRSGRRCGDAARTEPGCATRPGPCDRRSGRRRRSRRVPGVHSRHSRGRSSGSTDRDHGSLWRRRARRNRAPARGDAADHGCDGDAWPHRPAPLIRWERGRPRPASRDGAAGAGPTNASRRSSPSPAQVLEAALPVN